MSDKIISFLEKKERNSRKSSFRLFFYLLLITVLVIGWTSARVSRSVENLIKAGSVTHAQSGCWYSTGSACSSCSGCGPDGGCGNAACSCSCSCSCSCGCSCGCDCGCSCGCM